MVITDKTNKRREESWVGLGAVIQKKGRVRKIAFLYVAFQIIQFFQK